jgi:DNA/RNA-binding domain of Phe-tRNA-synthetase-like protein
VRATGAEPFDTTKDGQPANDPPLAGEVVWADDLGVTCRRWNWRQCTRTPDLQVERARLGPVTP